MNIELANRLYEYRKQSGLSQEELAEKLGISRQSVSKWERAESCPDTDNLIELAKVYNVSIDELLNTNKEIKKETIDVEFPQEESKVKVIVNKSNNFKEDDKENNIIFLENEIKVNPSNGDPEYVLSYDELYTEVEGKETKIVDIEKFGKEKKEVSYRARKVKDAINGCLSLVIVGLYIALCSLEVMEWGKFWVVFVFYPVITSLVESIVNKDANDFAFPVFCAGVYVTIGMYLGKWHPYWFIFILVPIYYVIVNAFEKKIIVYFYDGNNEKHNIAIKHGDLKVVSKKDK